MKTIRYYFAKVKTYALAHKIISAIVVVVVLGGAWYMYANANSGTAATRYVLGSVTQGTIVSVVSESGQADATDDLSITPQVSGQITDVAVTAGEEAEAGLLISAIDPTTADQQIENDKQSLESAQLSLQKLEEPAQAATLTEQQD